MTKSPAARIWAKKISEVLTTVLGAGRFPVNVKDVALEYSRQVFPDDPISLVKGDNLSGFDGALYPAPKGKRGWGIFYNTGISSLGRINFTLAHEFGHYLIHRHDYPDGLDCSQEDMARWEGEYRQVEHQANEFAAFLLMPLDDFRLQIDSKYKPSLNDIGACADRYQVSLLAATLRWLQYTERRSVLVVSREGFILWARSSTPAFKSGKYFKIVGRPPIPVPETSIPASISSLEANELSLSHPSGVWFDEPCEEIAILSDQYDFAISLLHFGNVSCRADFDDEETVDMFDRLKMRTLGTSWLE